ncbi:oligoribonuclease, partial [Salmonella enterica subsp. enterica serovar Heidelberg str. 607310-1]
SGLVDRVKASTMGERDAELATIEFLKTWVPAGKSPICGNSIGQDRRFLFKYMPELEAYFHYRYLDVSTLKELETYQHHFTAAVFITFGNLTTQLGNTCFDLRFGDHDFNSMFHIYNHMI